MAGEWWGGISEEWFNVGPFESREAIIAEMRGVYCEDKSRPFWIGQQESYEPFTRNWVEECFELEAGDVSDSCGPGASDDWPPRIPAEQCKEANAKIAAILKELAGECSVFPIGDIEKIEASS
jgi:hypothetical protein